MKTELTNEQIRVAIAEACGHIVTDHHGMPPEQWQQWYSNVSEIIPDYLNSLDAMAEAEKVLTAEQRFTFAKQLLMIVSGFPFVSPERADLHFEELFGVAHATARQRALAFLATIAP